MKRSWSTYVILGVGCCLAGLACNDGYSDGSKLWPDRFSPRTRWRASGDLRDPQNAVDGNPSTAAVSNDAYQNATLTIDLGKDCMFNMVVVNHGPDEFGFCHRMAVLTSYDGVNFIKQVEVPGLRKVTTAVLIKPVLARYIRLRAVVPGDRPWSVAEIHLN